MRLICHRCMPSLNNSFMNLGGDTNDYMGEMDVGSKQLNSSRLQDVMDVAPQYAGLAGKVVQNSMCGDWHKSDGCATIVGPLNVTRGRSAPKTGDECPASIAH